MAATIHVGDVKTLFQITIKDEAGVPVDLSTASTLQIKFSNGKLPTITRTATFVTNGTDGQIQYYTQASDFTAPGLWEIEAYYALANGDIKHSSIETVLAVGNL